MHKVLYSVLFLLLCSGLVYGMRHDATDDRSALSRVHTCHAITGLNEQFALLKAHNLIYSPETEEVLRSADNLALLRACVASIHEDFGIVDEQVGQQLPDYATATKTKLVTAIHLLIERARSKILKAGTDIAAGEVRLDKFFKHTGKAYKRKCRMFDAMAKIDPANVALVDQSIEGGIRWLGNGDRPAGMLADVKDIVAMGLGKLLPLKLEQDVAALKDQKDKALLEHITTYAKRPVAPETPGDELPSSSVAQIAENTHKFIEVMRTCWPTAKTVAVAIQDTDVTGLKSHLLTPVDAPLTTFCARFTAPALDTSVGRWATGKVGGHPALPAAGSAYLNGVRALRTLLVTNKTFESDEKFDEWFTKKITESVATPEIAAVLKAASIRRACTIGDSIMSHVQACDDACTEFARHADVAQKETDGFLAFLKVLGEHDKQEMARLALLPPR